MQEVKTVGGLRSVLARLPHTTELTFTICAADRWTEGAVDDLRCAEALVVDSVEVEDHGDGTADVRGYWKGEPREECLRTAALALFAEAIVLHTKVESAATDSEHDELLIEADKVSDRAFDTAQAAGWNHADDDAFHEECDRLGRAKGGPDEESTWASVVCAAALSRFASLCGHEAIEPEPKRKPSDYTVGDGVCWESADRYPHFRLDAGEGIVETVTDDSVFVMPKDAEHRRDVLACGLNPGEVTIQFDSNCIAQGELDFVGGERMGKED